ncbi:hypothetical protein N7495_006935 [Penicillium taxi]|uniref:uncharacterized protein n=1 Tax=Penicillium taxi TaxID=168475 RepID=UPI0025451921|nr:uncharacterized protein N7495_006935 [Penicillium taxi]KAJ5895244.1 hypothetical protein N7495_006935 [Penicillium taxi]
MTEAKTYLNEEDFRKGTLETVVPSLKALDREMGADAWIVTFAPIRIIAAGGFLSVSYLKNRDSTGDIDYLLDPEVSDNDDLQSSLHQTIRTVARKMDYNHKWINEDMAIFVTKRSRETLFEQAAKQGITLFRGNNLEILAAPLEWALERKLRRIHAADRGRKTECDVVDALALLRELRVRNAGPLDEEEVRKMNVNGFDVLPGCETMQRVRREYRFMYNEEIFS